jgi:4,5-epoxidase
MVDVDVLVVGAGPAGLALACGLRAQGLSVRVVDKADGPATTSRANFVHARGSEVLDRLGALDDLPSRSVPAMLVTTYLGGKPVMRVHFGDSTMRTAAPPMVISQAAVEGSLRARLAELDGDIEWNSKVVGIEQDDQRVVAELDDGRRLGARWLAGCDGASSATRRLVDIAFPGAKLTERFLLADVRLDWDLDRAGTSGWIHPDGMIGAMPMPDDSDRLWRIIAYDPGQPSDKPSPDAIAARIAEILPARTGLEVAVTDHEWLSEFHVHRRLADDYRRGRVIIVGDAAHTHAPFGGQGMLTGLGDAENLAWKLALIVNGGATPALLDTYQAERRPLATEVLRSTSAVTKLNIADRPVGRFLRDHVLVRVFNQPALQRWATYQASQLWVSYRGGPLADRALPGFLPGRRPRPGDRVPDQPCITADGHVTRLYEALRGHWVHLRSGGSEPLPAPDGTDAVVALRRTDPAPFDDFLVRPDGHLAWRGRDRDDMRRWIRDVARTGGAR